MHLTRTRLVVSLSVSVLCQGLDAQSSASGTAKAKAPKGFEKVDHDIHIGMLNARLRFDLEKFSVKPGSKVKLTLANNDSMQHNLIICKPGKGVLERIAAGALALGSEASEKHFVPDLPEVLFHTNALMPGQEHTIWFRAPEKAAKYPYICTLPGHTFTMRGVMTVGDVEDSLISNLRYDLFKGAFRLLKDMTRVTPVKKRVLKTGVIDIGRVGERSNFGVWFHADLRIEKAGKYSFFLRSDDGSCVRVDGTQVVADDGTHGLRPFKKGEIELGTGRHELRVEFFQGGGGKGLHVDMKGPGLRRRSLTANADTGRPRGVPIMVMHDPVVMRVHVQNAVSRSIALGLPGGMNCVFDAGACRMQFGWAGAFLDVGPDRLGRGGRPCGILGRRFEVGDVGFPLRRAGSKENTVRYLGYKTGPETQFLLDWDGQDVAWSVTGAPSGVGLRYTFEIPGIKTPVQFAIDRDGLDVASTAGTWSGGVLTVPANAAAKFSVTLTRSSGGDK